MFANDVLQKKNLTMDSPQLLPTLKHFVKSSEHTLTSSQSICKATLTPRVTLVSGAKIREFYEKAVGREAFEKQKKPKFKQDRSAILLKPKAPKNPLNINLLMKAVESGKVKDVQKLLEENQEGLNCKDQFDWTPLMSACCAGNLPMVQLLLQWKPDVSACDKRGLNCRDLASMRGHHSVVDTLDHYLKDLQKPTVTNEQSTEKHLIETFYCKVCKQNIENTTLKKHLSSTVHNFNSSSKRRMQTMYGIPESNKGFQILVRSGWDKECGLGPSGEGHKYPPKTILKQDRTGLGAKQYKARVTHTLEDTNVKSKQVRNSKRDLKFEKRKERKLERDLRRLLS